jgi:hypothetical protein
VRPFITRASRYVIVLEPNLLGTAAARTLIGDLAKFGIPLSRIWIVTNLRGGRSRSRPANWRRRSAVPSSPKFRAKATAITRAPSKRSQNGSCERATEIAAWRCVLPPTLAAGHGGPDCRRRLLNGVHAHSEPTPCKDVRPGADKRDRLKMEIHEQVTKRIDVVAASRAHTDGQKIAELRAADQRSHGPAAQRTRRHRRRPRSAPSCSKRSSTKRSASGRSKT